MNYNILLILIHFYTVSLFKKLLFLNFPKSLLKNKLYPLFQTLNIKFDFRYHKYKKVLYLFFQRFATDFVIFF